MLEAEQCGGWLDASHKDSDLNHNESLDAIMWQVPINSHTTTDDYLSPPPCEYTLTDIELARSKGKSLQDQ